MPNDTITLVLDGEVLLGDFATVVSGWFEVLKAIGGEVNGAGEVQWAIEHASGGSFSGTLKAIYRASEHEPVAEVTRRFTKLGKDMRRQEMGGYSLPIRSGASKIASVIGERVTFIRFETDEDDAEIHAPIIETAIPADVEPNADEEFRIEKKEFLRQSYGVIRGEVQNLASRKSLRFTLYESNSDRAVSCYVLPGRDDLMRDAWGKLALVEGVVRRDPETGHPTTIREVRNITVLPPIVRGAWRDAIGCAPAGHGEPSPEASIRGLRDAE